MVPPTCTEDGYKLFKCSCGRWYTQKDKEKTGHKWNDWLVTVIPTASTEGMEERVCSVCGKKESRVLEKEAAATAEELEQELLKILRRTIPKNTKRNPRSSTQSINMQADRTDMRQSAKRLRLL